MRDEIIDSTNHLQINCFYIRSHACENCFKKWRELVTIDN